MQLCHCEFAASFCASKYTRNLKNVLIGPLLLFSPYIHGWDCHVCTQLCIAILTLLRKWVGVFGGCADTCQDLLLLTCCFVAGVHVGLHVWYEFVWRVVVSVCGVCLACA